MAVVEEVVTSQSAAVTGLADAPNPEYSAELDTLGKPAGEAEAGESYL